MIQAVHGDRRALLGLCQDESTLDHRLHVGSEARGAPLPGVAGALLGLGDVRFQHGEVLAEAFLARGTNLRMRLIRLLDHRTQQTGELGQLTAQQRLAQFHVGEKPLDRIRQRQIGNRGEKPLGHRGEMPRCLDGQILLAGEMMEERTFGHARGRAQLIHRRGGIALGAHDLHGGIQQSCFRGWLRSHPCTIPTGRSAVNPRPWDRKRRPPISSFDVHRRRQPERPQGRR